VKDRIAWGMIREDLGEITARGQTLIEASSGNTAKALQVLAGVHGLRLRALTNRAKVGEVRDLLQLLGAELEELLGLSECPDPTGARSQLTPRRRPDPVSPKPLPGRRKYPGGVLSIPSPGLFNTATGFLRSESS
jgi:hypothetical protein